jgi:hypothetical protein
VLQIFIALGRVWTRVNLGSISEHANH